MAGLKINLSSPAKKLIEMVNESTEASPENIGGEPIQAEIAEVPVLTPKTPREPTSSSQVEEHSEEGDVGVKKKRISISDIHQQTPVSVQEAPETNPLPKQEAGIEASKQDPEPIKKVGPTIRLTQVIQEKTQEIINTPTPKEEPIVMTKPQISMSPPPSSTQEPVKETEKKTETPQTTTISIVDGDTVMTMTSEKKSEIFGAYHSDFDKSKPKPIEKKVEEKKEVKKTTPTPDSAKRSSFSPLSIFSKQQKAPVVPSEPVVEPLKVPSQKKPFSTTQKSLIGVFGFIAFLGLGLTGVFLMPDGSQIKSTLYESIGIQKEPQTPTTPTQQDPIVTETPTTPTHQDPIVTETPVIPSNPVETSTGITQNSTPPTPTANSTISPGIKKALLKKFNKQ